MFSSLTRHNKNTTTNDNALLLYQQSSSTQPHFTNNNKSLPTIVKYDNNIQQTTTDDHPILSPSITSPTTSISSIQSSLSSISSSTNTTHHYRRRKCDSLPVKPTLLLYPTLKSALSRIEYLEEEMKYKGQIVKDLSLQIETFLKNKKEEVSMLHISKSNGDTTSGNNTLASASPIVSMSFIVDKLNELKQLVKEEYNIVLEIEEGNEDKEVFFSTQMIEKWFHGVTQDNNNKDTTQLIQVIHTLNQKHNAAKKEIISLTHSHNLEINTLNEKLKLQVEEKEQLEQLVEQLRKKMEELNKVNKSKKAQQQHGISTITADLKSIIMQKNEDNNDNDKAYQQQLDILIKEKETFKSQLVNAQRSIAELSLLLEVTKRQQEPNELTQLKIQLEKSLQEIEQEKLEQEKRLNMEFKIRLQEIENKYQKESDTFQLRISREIRELTGQVVELELELERYEDKRYNHEKELIQQERQANEEEKKSIMEELKQKIILLEQDVLMLYSKNLALARQLGNLDSC